MEDRLVPVKIWRSVKNIAKIAAVKADVTLQDWVEEAIREKAKNSGTS